MAEKPVGNVLLVVDSTDAVVRAARFTLQLAGSLQCAVHAAFVVDTETLRQLLAGRILVAQEMEELEEDLTAQGRRYLHMVEELSTEFKLQVQTHLLKGTWSAAILEEAKRVQADLLVISGFQYSMTKRDLVSRQKQIIIDDAPCPVLIVR